MKRFGKQENAPEPKVKKDNSLLRTYLSSVVSLALCATMFLGTTMAWFTDTVGNQGNKIMVGNLSVKLELKTGDGVNDYLDLGEGAGLTTPIFGATKLSSTEDLRWVPGHLEVRTLRVTNNGDVDFNYSLDAEMRDANGAYVPRDTSIDPNNENDPYNLADHFLVYYRVDDAAQPQPTTVTEIRNDTANWKMVSNSNTPTVADATLSKVFQESAICSGSLEKKPAEGTATPHIEYITVAIYMKEDTPSNFAGKNLENIYISMTASQQGNVTIVNNAFELQHEMTKNGNTIVLGNDIVVPDSMVLAVENTESITLNLNNKTLKTNTEARTEPLFDVKGTLHLNYGTVEAHKVIANMDGFLCINGGTYKSAAGTAFTLGTNGQFTVNGGIINAVTLVESTSIEPDAVNINGGTITVTTLIEKSNGGNGKVNIEGGIISSHAVTGAEAGNIIISGGKLIGLSTVSGLEGNRVIFNSGTINITGGTFEPAKVYKKTGVVWPTELPASVGQVTVETEPTTP